MRSRYVPAGVGAALFLLLSGCVSVNARVAVGPTVDTAGNPGVEGRLSAGFGGEEVRGTAGAEQSRWAITLDPWFAVGHLGQRDEVVTVGGGGAPTFLWFLDPIFALRFAVPIGGRSSIGVPAGAADGVASIGFEMTAEIALGESRMIWSSYLLGLGARVDGMFTRFESRAVFTFPLSFQIQAGYGGF